MRMDFDDSLAIDARARLATLAMVTGGTVQVYSAEEETTLAEGKALFAMFEGQGGKTIKVSSPLTRAKLTHKKVRRCSTPHIISIHGL
jgi:hypothetical protein